MSVTVIVVNLGSEAIQLENLHAINDEIKAGINGETNLSDFNSFDRVRGDEQLATLINNDAILMKNNTGLLTKAYSLKLIEQLTLYDIEVDAGIIIP